MLNVNDLVRVSYRDGSRNEYVGRVEKDTHSLLVIELSGEKAHNGKPMFRSFKKTVPMTVELVN